MARTSSTVPSVDQSLSSYRAIRPSSPPASNSSPVSVTALAEPNPVALTVHSDELRRKTSSEVAKHSRSPTSTSATAPQRILASSSAPSVESRAIVRPFPVARYATVPSNSAGSIRVVSVSVIGSPDSDSYSLPEVPPVWSVMLEDLVVGSWSDDNPVPWVADRIKVEYTRIPGSVGGSTRRHPRTPVRPRPGDRRRR